MNDKPAVNVEDLLSDEEIRERHRNDLSRALEVLKEISEGTAGKTGIAGEELRDFVRDHG